MPSARLAGFDYGRGVFFVTVVTAGRVPWFGRLADGRVRLLPPGRVVAEEWARTGVVRADVTVDALVVMPDHVHGILALGGETEAVAGRRGGGDHRGGAETPHRGVSTAGAGRAWRPGVLGAVIGRWKGRVHETDPTTTSGVRVAGPVPRRRRSETTATSKRTTVHRRQPRPGTAVVETPRWGVSSVPRPDGRPAPLAALAYGASAAAAAASVAIETRMSSAEAVDATAARSLSSAFSSA